MIETLPMNNATPALSEKLATEENALLWQAATNATLHGPKCACVGFGLMRRSSAELERDIVEFLLAKYEEMQRVAIVHLFQCWLAAGDTQPGLSGSAAATAHKREGLLRWIDRNAPDFAVTDDDLRDIGNSIRTLLQSLAAPAGGFVCV